MVIFLLSWEIWATAKGLRGTGSREAVEVAKLKPLWEEVAGDRERGRLWSESTQTPVVYGIS